MFRNLRLDIAPAFSTLSGFGIRFLRWIEIVTLGGHYHPLLRYSLMTVDQTLPFLLEFPHKVPKPLSKDLPNSQTVITPEGIVVTLNIRSADPCIFIPTDKVLSPLEEAAIIGFNDLLYFQIGAMRMLGCEAAVADVFTLSLLPRINRRAMRTIEIDNEPKQISLKAEEAVDQLLPGDAIFIDSVYGKVHRKSDTQYLSGR
jgi:hypothetical protein